VNGGFMKNIIFDLGNVLLSFHPDEYLSKYYDQKTLEDLMVIIFSSDEWLELDLGHLLIQQVIDIFCEQYPHYKKEITFVLNNWTDMLEPIEQNVNILKDLKKKGYKLYILSNFHIEAFHTVSQKYEFFKLFDGGIVSGFEHVIKPSEEIYKILIQKYHLNVKECLFIDDSLGNIWASERLGIQGIHLGYGVDLKEELSKKGIV
jgi:putative hydrolase of the HAD superfamily